MDKQEFTRTVPLGASDNVSILKMAPGYNQYHKLCTSEEVHTWDEEDPLNQEPDIVGNDDYDQPTVIYKDNSIDITCTGHTQSFQPTEILYDEDKSDTTEEPRGMVLCIPISPYHYQEYEAED